MEQKKSNRYAQQAKKKTVLGTITQDLETKGDVKNSAIETLKDVVVGVIGGGVVGAAIGRASLAVGALVTGVGHYTKSRLASVFGVGMMAASGYQKSDKAVSGTDDEEEPEMMDGVKDRVLNFRDSFKQKLYLDKLMKEKNEKKDEATAGVGEVQYFTYPENPNELEGAAALDMSDLERIEQQVAESGVQFAEKQPVSGILPADQQMGEMGYADEIDPAEMNY